MSDELDDFFETVGEYVAERVTDPAPDASTFDPHATIVTRGPISAWAVSGNIYGGISKSLPTLPAGCYKIGHSPERGPYLIKQDLRTDALLRLPDSKAEAILAEIEQFQTLRPDFEQRGFLFKRGVLLWGPPGCHAAGTEIVMADGSLKRVEDIAIGDAVLGPDSQPRRVLDLCRGLDQLFVITPRKGEPFVVNGHHRLSLVRTHANDRRYPPVMNVTVNDYLALSDCSQRSFKLYHAPGVEFPHPSSALIDPYVLGVWLGDGHEDGAAVTTADAEIATLVHGVAAAYGLHVTVSRKTDSRCQTYAMSGDGSGPGSNAFVTALRTLGVFGDKHIPASYMTASRPDRLQLLAGLIDTDGGYSTATWRPHEKFIKTGYKGFFEITQVRERLARQILSLARSLGFGATLRSVVKGIKRTGFSGTYWRVSIYGAIAEIPVRLARKQALIGRANKDPQRTGIAAIQPLGVGRYYGFTLSGDHLYLTSDYIVHHNSGKTSTLHQLMDLVVHQCGGIAVIVGHPSLASMGLQLIRQIEPTRQIVAIMEDLDGLISHHDVEGFLSLLDGEDQIDNVIYVATTNFPERLDKRFVDRPSRFDSVEYVGMPSPDARRVYLRTKDPAISPQDLEQMVVLSDGFSIAHLREFIILTQCFRRPVAVAAARLAKSRHRKLSSDKNPEAPATGFAGLPAQAIGVDLTLSPDRSPLTKRWTPTP